MFTRMPISTPKVNQESSKELYRNSFKKVLIELVIKVKFWITRDWLACVNFQMAKNYSGLTFTFGCTFEAKFRFQCHTRYRGHLREQSDALPGELIVLLDKSIILVHQSNCFTISRFIPTKIKAFFSPLNPNLINPTRST